MGNVPCKRTDEEMGAIVATKKIDKELFEEKVHSSKTFRILLLGSADSGKSTVVKQMRLLHKEGFSRAELIDASFQVRSNIVDAFNIIAEGIFRVGLQPTNQEMPLLDLFRYQKSSVSLMAENEELHLMQQFMELESVRTFLANKFNRSMVPDNFHYFFMHLERILQPNYQVTNQDMIHMRTPSRGVHEIQFDFKQCCIRLIDVGGQRTEQRKWIHFFEGVHAILFVASLASYDQLMEEETVNQEPPTNSLTINRRFSECIHVGQVPHNTHKDNRNRLTDSVELFATVAANAFLKNSSFILFLNKKDLLTEKLPFSKMNDHHKDYKGANDYDSVVSHIESMFLKTKLPTENMTIFPHVTQATDRENINYMFAAACEIILKANLNEAGL